MRNIGSFNKKRPMLLFSLFLPYFCAFAVALRHNVPKTRFLLFDDGWWSWCSDELMHDCVIGFMIDSKFVILIVEVIDSVSGSCKTLSMLPITCLYKAIV